MFQAKTLGLLSKTSARTNKRLEEITRNVLSILMLEQKNPTVHRCQPTAVLFEGKPGTGKSLMAAKLASHLRRLGVYSMNSSDEFEDGIEHASVVLVDELLTKRQGESLDLERMLRMISTVPYRPNFARLELKSKISHFSLLLATTNADFTKLNTPYYQQALRRRFCIVADFDEGKIFYNNKMHKLDFETLVELVDCDLKSRFEFFKNFVESCN